MSLRVAVVATHHGDPWSEPDLVVRRVCGALACRAEVDLLVPGPAPAASDHEGAVRVSRFPAAIVAAGRRAALHRALLGPVPGDATIACHCTEIVQRRLAAGLPGAAQEALLLAGGGYSRELFGHLTATPYDVVVFAGCDNAATYWGMEAVAGRRPCVLVPAAVAAPGLWNPAVAEVLEAADRILVTTPVEGDILRHLAPGLKPDVVHDVGFVVQVNAMAARAPAFGFDGRPTVIIARDWAAGLPIEGLLDWCDALLDDLGPALTLRLVGPGTQRLPRRLRAESAGSRTDVWRWMAHALAVLDPEPHRLLGREVLESLLFATPVIVAAGGGAARHHAEAGDGGLWYRTYQDLRACVEALLDDGVRTALGRQGRIYAATMYGDSPAFVDRVGDAVLAMA